MREILELCIRLDRFAHESYEAMAVACRDPDVASVFARMAKEERAHVAWWEDLLDAWDKGLKPLKALHHQAGNYIVAVGGDQADAFCYGIASHFLPTKSGRNTRTFVGSYDFHLIKKDGVWWIDRFKFNLKYIDGNPDLEKDQ